MQDIIYNKKKESSNNLANEIFENHKIVKSFLKRDYEVNRYQKSLNAQKAYGKKRAFIQSIFQFFQSMILCIIIIGSILFTIFLLDRGLLTKVKSKFSFELD